MTTETLALTPRDASLLRDPAIARYSVGGVPVAATTMDGLARSVERRLALGRAAPGTYVVFCGAHGVVDSQDDPALLAAHERAFLVCPDGRPLFWVGRLRGHAVHQVPGIESVEALCRAGVARGHRHYFVGGGDGVAVTLAAAMAARVPGLRVAGAEGLPFRPMTGAEDEALRARLRDAGAQIVWVGLGTPKQELFMALHAPHLPGTVAMGVGAAFDVNIGRIRRAPRWMQRAGLEWTYRLSREPRRLWRRYGSIVPRFAGLALREELSRRLRAG